MFPKQKFPGLRSKHVGLRSKHVRVPGEPHAYYLDITEDNRVVPVDCDRTANPETISLW